MNRRSLLFSVLVLLFATIASAQMPQTYERGFSADKVYQYGDIDHVNHFNGNLVLAVPVGPSFPLKGSSYQLTLVYNSSIWDVMEVYPTDPLNDCYQTKGNCKQLWSYPARRFNAGLGWSLSLGRKFEKYDAENASQGPIYVSPDGAEHSFGGNLPADGSYLRTTATALQTPDGSSREFSEDPALKPKNAFGWLSTMRDANGNGVDVVQICGHGDDAHVCTAPERMCGDHLCDEAQQMLSEWRITDTEGRVHHVYFQDFGAQPGVNPPFGPQLPEQRVAVSRVVLQGPAGDMTYSFEYGTDTNPGLTTIGHSCAGADHTGFSEMFAVPLLHRVKLPDTSYYEASYTGNGGCDPGQISALQLPSVKGQLQWTYGGYLYPDGSCTTSPYHGVYGVRERRLVDINGNLVGKWTYTPGIVQTPAIEMQCSSGGDGGQAISKMVKQEFTNTVDDPYGMRTIYHFTALPELAGSAPPTTISKGEYGFPMCRLHPNDIGQRRYLSTEKQTCGPCDGNGNCGGWYCTTFEEKYIRYVSDDTVVDNSGNVVSVGDFPNNPRIESEQTKATSNGSSESTWTDRSDFDGFGHYRKTTTSGSFGGSPVRETYVDFNPGSDAAGTVFDPATNARKPAFASSDPWVLNTYDYTWSAENGVYSKTEACVDRTTGFLAASRMLRNSGSSPSTVPRSSSDAMVWYTNGGGVVTREDYYGGDLQANLADTALCGMTRPATAEYSIGHSYSHGALASTSYYNGTTEILPKVVDRTIGLSGLPTSERDSAGLETTYTYDANARLKQVQPPGTSPVVFTYGFALTGIGPIGYSPASVAVDRGDTHVLYQFDSFGHVWRELHRMPSPADQTYWSMRQMDRDADGRTVRESTYERITDPIDSLSLVPSLATQYSYAQEGWLASVTLPDGTSTSTTPSMLSKFTKRTPYTAADGTSQIAVSQETRNPLGRLTSVAELQWGGSSPGHTTNYAYDLGGNLISVGMTRGSVTQNRFFSYDQLGRLRAETHPEKGVTGYGTVGYPTYDSRGHLRSKIEGVTDGPFDLVYNYDNRERLLAVTEPDPSSNATPKARRDLKTFAYGSTNAASTGGTDYRAGKLSTTARHNRDGVLGDVVVTETYHYVDAAGRLTSRDTAVSSTAAFDGATFSASQQWNALDQISSVGYPQTTTASGVAGDRNVGYAYTNGFLTSVGTYASSITYQPSGMPDQVTHGLAPYATIQKWTPDPSHMARPCSILVAPPGTTLTVNGSAPCDLTISGNAASWNSGQYHYDAAGNITQIGTRSYVYDFLSRLAVERDGGLSTTYGYDGFGNMNLQTTTIASASAPATGGNYGGTFSRSFNKIDVDPSTNRLTGATFDAAGNVTAWPAGTTYEWDNAGSMHALHANGRDVVYLYTADDERVASISRIPDVNVITRNRTSWTLRGFSQQLLRTWVDDSTSGSRTWSWSEDEIWRGTTLLATESLGGTHHIFTDHLGSPRFITDSVGQSLGTIPFSSFGSGGATGMGALQFTGHERDLGTNSSDALDYMHARYYSAAVGRFLSVDPILGKPELPQTWNRYSYVANNPLTRTDPAGRCFWDGCALEAAAVVEAAIGVTFVVGVVYGAIHTAFSERADPYAPERKLPTDPHTGNPVIDPHVVGPHTQLGKRTSKSTGETYVQGREFDENGNRVKDIDHTDHGRKDHDNPHEHPYDPATGKRLPNQPLQPGVKPDSPQQPKPEPPKSEPKAIAPPCYPQVLCG